MSLNSEPYWQRTLNSRVFKRGNAVVYKEKAPEGAFQSNGECRLIEILQSATSVAAKLLTQEGKLGVIAPGAHADLVVVDGDPTADITLLCEPEKAIVGVMKGGIWEHPLRA